VRSRFHDDDDIWILKVPGRVNLIGEHVDYNNGPVLPCAIDREIIICLKPASKGMIQISNVDAQYPVVSFSVEEKIKPFEKGHWGNYVKAGAKGILDHAIKSSLLSKDRVSGFDAIVSGTVPQAAGLSSSSTLVVGAAMAMLKVNELHLSNLKIAEICASAEHFVGTAGGGMDHAAILLGEENSFLKIEFNPLSAEPISAPNDIEMVLFHSLIEAEKSSFVREAYNKRVLECNFAKDLFNLYLSKSTAFSQTRIDYLGDIKESLFGIENEKLERLTSEFLNSLAETYSLRDLLRHFDLSKDDLTDKYQHVLRGAKLNDESVCYNLKSRFRHVYSECQRVNQAVSCLKSNDKIELGNLLNLSHKSLSEDYDVSTPEVDSIVNLLKENGAYGARMVGAGFGGMILALTDKSHAIELIGKMQQALYSGKPDIKSENSIIRCKATEGAGFI
jgi:galactokinase